MRKTMWLLAFGVFCTFAAAVTYQWESTGQASTRDLVVAACLVPVWGIPLFRKVYYSIAKRGRR